MDQSCPPLSPEKLERVREIDHLLTQERLFLTQAASRAYHGTPLATDPVDILHPNNTVNAIVLRHTIRLINLRRVTIYGPNVRKRHQPDASWSPILVSMYVDHPVAFDPVSTTVIPPRPGSPLIRGPVATTSVHRAEDTTPQTIILKRKRSFYDLTLGAFDAATSNTPVEALGPWSQAQTDRYIRHSYSHACIPPILTRIVSLLSFDRNTGRAAPAPRSPSPSFTE
ncbi:hypothetical protein MJO29_012417 [Puccinia striiformis f. sp. tritici]|nr:hypothetical protein MJO29_012417 [Puccinia striiformis f. sp. tritici]